MTKEELLGIINELREDEGELPLNSLIMTDNLKDDIGFDSMTLAQLTVMIEAEYGIDIFENGLIHTVQEVYDKVNRQ